MLSFNGKVRLVKNYVACKIKSVKGVVLFLGGASCIPQFLPTKRAVDAGDSGAFSSIFLRLSLFRLDGVPPSAPAPLTQAVSVPLRENLWVFSKN